MKRVLVFLLFFSLAASSCREQGLLFVKKEQAPNLQWKTYSVEEFLFTRPVDILWVVDNSGSMSSYQKDLIQNTNKFIDTFLNYAVAGWRMGIISTDDTESPYVGFTSNDRLNETTTDPIKTFQRAIGRLGTNGSATEKVFASTVKALTKYPDFIRPNSMLFLIVITDAKEQSEMSAGEFIDFLKKLKNGLDDVFTYGAFAHEDFNCDPEESGVTYSRSKYEEVFNVTSGKPYALCKDFGTSLATMAEDIGVRAGLPRINLEHRPMPGTIVVKYNGKEIPGGPEEVGGLWFYNYELNAIVFHTFEIYVEGVDSIEVAYEPSK